MNDLVLVNDVYVDLAESWTNHIHALNVRKSIWQKHGNCIEEETSTMYSPRVDIQTQVAHTICDDCDMKLECLYFALVAKDEDGVWGGKTEAERKAIQKSITADGFGDFKTNWTSNHEEYILSLAKYLIAQENDTKILQET